MVGAPRYTKREIWGWLGKITDPEIPVISLVDLGVVRDVAINAEVVEIVITPTYIGCPATSAIKDEIKAELTRRGVRKLSLVTKLVPAWTTEWISERGAKKLEEYGIAPPNGKKGPDNCPQCGSMAVDRVSQFGSTPCKAQWRCLSCLEPFEFFKCI